jgi:hypothetical protein
MSSRALRKGPPLEQMMRKTGGSAKGPIYAAEAPRVASRRRAYDGVRRKSQ